MAALFENMAPPFKNFPLGIRLLLMLAMFFAMLVMASIVAVLGAYLIFGKEVVKGLDGSGEITSSTLYAALLVQGISAIGIFIITSIGFSVLEVGEFKFHLRLTSFPPIKMVLMGMFAILVAQCFIPALVELNKMIPLPAALAFLKSSSEKTAELEKLITTFNNPLQFVLVSLVIALIPAIGEEMFFRGLLLGDLLKGKMNPLSAILISGLIFSISHHRFENVLAIWLMGSFLGYLYYVSGSLWLPVIVHFTNNFATVIVKGLYNTHAISMNPDTFQPPIYAVLISSLIFLGCLFAFQKWKVAPFYTKPDPFSPTEL